MDTGKKIAQCRKELGMSQEALAAEMGISRQAVSRWETGEALPDTAKIILLARLFNVSCDYLLLDEVEAKAPANEGSLASALDRAFAWLKKIFRELRPALKQMRFALLIGLGALVLGWLLLKLGLGIAYLLYIAGGIILVPSCGVVIWELIKIIRKNRE